MQYFLLMDLKLIFSMSLLTSIRSLLDFTQSIVYRNPQCLSAQDSAAWLEVINPMSTEMLLSGSTDGIVKVWDVHLNVHSHEMEKVSDRDQRS